MHRRSFAATARNDDGLDDAVRAGLVPGKFVVPQRERECAVERLVPAKP